MHPEVPDSQPPPSENLLALVYDELRRHAAGQLLRRGDDMTLQATELVHEAWMCMSAKDRQPWQSRDHFFATAVVAMRHILVDRVRQKASQKRKGTKVELELADTLSTSEAITRILTLDECMEQLAKDYPDCVKIVQMKFFAGLSNEETAQLLQCSLRTVERQWAFARAKLYQMILKRETEEDTGHE